MSDGSMLKGRPHDHFVRRVQQDFYTFQLSDVLLFTSENSPAEVSSYG